jgi:hypothetical protein
MRTMIGQRMGNHGTGRCKGFHEQIRKHISEYWRGLSEPNLYRLDPAGIVAFGSLYQDGKLHYFGHSGSGFTEKGLKEAVARLKPFFTNKSPFENPPKIPEKVQWVEPVFVCEVAFAEWTLDGELRQTTFLEWRDDKAPKELVLSQPLPG